MAKITLAETDLDALFAVICLLRDMPVQTRRDVEALRARPGLLKRNLSAASEGAGKAPDYPGKDGSFRAQIAALQLALGRWEARGEVPPSVAPTLIQLTLSAAQADSFEKAFLGVFCFHFGAEYAERFGHLVERAVKLGVFPLPMKVTKADRPIGRLAVDRDAIGELDAETADLVSEQTGAMARDPAQGKVMPAPPLSPTARLARRARFGLQTNLPPPSTRDGHWRPLSGSRR